MKVETTLKNNFDFSNLRLIHLAFFTALAIALYVVESFIPRPFPFIKLGLANLVVLLLLVNDYRRFALIVILGKTVIGGFFSGLLFSPTTLLSLGGSLISFCVMVFIIKSRIPFSIIGISVLGAVSHNITQIVIVRFVLIKENTIFCLTPLLIILGIVTGIIIGYLAKIFMGRLNGEHEKRSS
ncbi:MAG: Gx transporter family protein [Candidatus Cloacimonetes bacterium]|nr:Gx transporter family protein [Candidatus Cloacimonadota bacterium]